MAEHSSRQLPLGLLTLAAAAAVAASQFTAAFGLTTFFADLVKAVALVAAGVGWWRSGPESHREAGFQTAPRPEGVSWRKVLRRSGTVFLLLLALWSLWPPLRHLRRDSTPWILCGEFRSACGGTACLKLRDSLTRPLRADCLPLADITSYAQFVAKNRFEYRPTSVGLRCQGEDVYRELGDEMFSQACDGEMEW